MASGLVPVTTRVGAVPEFVDENCSLLCPAEDAGALAQAIEQLAASPELFCEMSKNTAANVRKDRAATGVVARELQLLGVDRRR